MKKITFFILLVTFVCEAQLDSIILPKKGIDSFDFKIKHHTIHVTKNNEIFFNRKRIRFWDEITSLVLKEERQPSYKAVQDIVLYIDKDVPIFNILRIRDELGKVWQGYLHYISDSLDGYNCLSFYIKSSFLARKSITKNDFFYEEEIIYTNKEKSNEAKIPKLKGTVKFPVLAIWQLVFSEIFFTEKLETIKKALNNVNYSTVNTSECVFDGLTNDEILKRKKQLEKIIKENDVLFVRSYALTSFGEYYKGMIQLQKRRILESNSGDLKKPFIIEVSYAYDEYLKKNGLDLFNMNSSKEKI